MSAVSGLTAMRVITQETAVASAIIPCGSYSLGETEDYMINIRLTVGFQNNFQSKSIFSMLIHNQHQIC